MKNEFIIGICLLAIIIGGQIIFTPGQQGVPAGATNGAVDQPTTTLTTESSDIAGRLSHNLVMKEISKSTADTVLVYKTVPPVVNSDATLAFAKKFNVTGTLRGETTVQSEDLVYGITLTKKSGSVEYSNSRRPNANQDAPKYLPSDDEAIKIATKFLKDRDLYPEGAVEPVAVRENAYTVGKGDEVYYGRIGVWYPRYLNGLKVEGTQLVVYVGGNGDVIDYFANWRDYEPYKELPIKTQDAAFNQMKAEGVGVGMNEKDSPVSIDNAYLAYQTTPGAYSEEYLRPVWVFKGNVTVDGKSVMPVEKYIPALTDDAVKSLSSS